MHRTEKILRLVAVGFSATELSRSSNALLDATYESAKPLMKAKQEEVDRVIAREGKHSRQKKDQLARRQREQDVEEKWLRTWKPLPPIQTVNTNIHDLEVKIESSREEMERYKALFRETGHRAHAEAANRAQRAMKTFEGYLAHLVKEEA